MARAKGLKGRQGNGDEVRRWLCSSNDQLAIVLFSESNDQLAIVPFSVSDDQLAIYALFSPSFLSLSTSFCLPSRPDQIARYIS